MNQITLLLKIAVYVYKIRCQNRNCVPKYLCKYILSHFKPSQICTILEKEKDRKITLCMYYFDKIFNCRNCSTNKIGCQNRNFQLLSHVLFHIDDDLQHRNNVLKTSEKLVRSRSFYIELIRFRVDYHCGWLLA